MGYDMGTGQLGGDPTGTGKQDRQEQSETLKE